MNLMGHGGQAPGSDQGEQSQAQSCLRAFALALPATLFLQVSMLLVSFLCHLCSDVIFAQMLCGSFSGPLIYLFNFYFFAF